MDSALMAPHRHVLLALLYIFVATQRHGVNGIRQGGPTITDVRPVKGPLEGKTLVTITVSTVNTEYLSYPVFVKIGNLTIPVENGGSGNSSFVVITPSASEKSHTYDEIPQPISVVFSDSLSYSSNFTFTYSSLTVITSIYPQEYIYTGGIRLTVYGEGLDIAVTPTLEVSTVGKLIAGKRWHTSTATYQTPCSETNATKIICILPRLQIPTQIRSYLNGLNPVYTDFNQAVNRLLTHRYVDDGNGNTMFVYVGLIFDGNVKYRNLADRLGKDNGSFVLIPGPTIRAEESQPIDLALENSGFRSISGEMWTIGLSVDDISVFLEGVQLPVLSVDSGSLTYGISSVMNINTNASLFVGFTCKHSYFHFQIYVGYRQYNQSCILVKEACLSQPCQNHGTCRNVNNGYQCSCMRDFYGRNCTEHYPTIVSLYPSYGPIAGGTKITINLTVPQQFTPISIYHGSKYIPVADNSSTLFTIVSPPSVNTTNVAVTIVFNWEYVNDDNATNALLPAERRQWNVSGQFQYRRNPTIQNMSPTSHIFTGGTTVTVFGTNLNSVALPYLNVSAVYLWLIGGYTPVSATSSFLSPCTINNPSMTCTFPVVDIPPGFLYTLDTKPYNASATGSLPKNVNVSSPNCERYQSSPGTSSSTITFYVGFQLDGIISFLNYKRIDVYPPPNICFNETLIEYNGQTMSIWGQHLLRGVTRWDYTIQIEDLPCNIIDITDDCVLFQPSVRNATPTFDYWTQWSCPPSYPFHLVVTVAQNQVYYAGCVDYNSVRRSNPCESVPCVNGATCTEVNNTTGYNCVCQPENYGPNCENVIPILNSLSPASGTISGGTTVTISANYTDNLIPTTINFFGSSVNLTITKFSVNESRSKRKIIFVTEEVNNSEKKDGKKFIVTVTFNDSTSWPVNASFRYRLNPAIASVSPQNHLTTGGTEITIQGTRLNIAVHPLMYIGVQIRSPSVVHSGSYDFQNEGEFITHNCTSDTNGENLLCKMPPTNVSDTDFDLTGGDGSSAFITTPLGKQLYVFVVLQFDNYHVNLSEVIEVVNSTLFLITPPTINLPSSVINFFPHHNQTVEIQGSGMITGANSRNDIEVFLGGEKCNVTSRTDTELWLNLTEDNRNMSSLADLPLALANCTNGYIDPSINTSIVYLIEVHIGYFNTLAGCVVYNFQIETVDIFHTLGIYVGVAIGSAILVIICIALITRPSDSG